jgi:WD40 repeat protein
MIKVIPLAPPSFAPPGKPDPTKTWMVTQLKHTSALIGCRIDPTGKYVFAGAQDNAVVRWDIATGKKAVLAGHKSWVRALAFAGKEKLLFSGDYAGRLLAWPLDAEAPTPKSIAIAHKGWLRALAVSPDGKTLASCGNDHQVNLWSIPDLKPLKKLSGHNCHVYNLAFHPDGKSLVSGDLKGNVKVWDLSKNVVSRELDAKILHKYDAGFAADIGGVRSMAFSKDGAILACAGITNVSNAFAGVGNPLVVLFDWKSGKQKQLLKPAAAFQGTAWGVAFHPDGYILGVGAGNGGFLWAWKPDKSPSFFGMGLPDNARDLDLHADNRRFAVAFFDGSVRLYDMTPKKA